MGRVYKTVIYINRDPQDLDKGWGWVELPQDFVREYNIEKLYPGSRRVQRSKEISVTRVKQDEQGNKCLSEINYIFVTKASEDLIQVSA